MRSKNESIKKLLIKLYQVSCLGLRCDELDVAVFILFLIIEG
jgi:hypothetical protein